MTQNYDDEKDKTRTPDNDHTKRLEEEIHALKAQQEELKKLIESLMDSKQTPPQKARKWKNKDFEQRLEEKIEKIEQPLEEFSEKMDEFGNRIGEFAEQYSEYYKKQIESSVLKLLKNISQTLGNELYQGIPFAELGKTKQGINTQTRVSLNKLLSISEEALPEFTKEITNLLSLFTNEDRLKILISLEHKPKTILDLNQELQIPSQEIESHLRQLQEKKILLSETLNDKYALSKLGHSILQLLKILYLGVMKPQSKSDD